MTHTLARPPSEQLSHALACQDWPQVIRACQLMLLHGPEHPKLYRVLGQAFTRQNQDQDAIAAYHQSLRLNPHQPDCHYILSILHGRQQQLPQAISHLQVALELRPNWDQAVLKLGDFLQQLGQYERAFALYQATLDQDPEQGSIHFALGQLQTQQSQHREAIKYFRNAIFLGYDHPDVYSHLGNALFWLHQPRAAAAVFSHALTLTQTDASVYNNLGQAKLLQGDIEAAAEAYQASLNLDPTLADAYQNLGRLWFRYQNFPQGNRYLQKALKLAPKRITILSDLAEGLRRQGRWSEFIDCLRIAVENHSEFVEAYCQQTTRLTGSDRLITIKKGADQLLTALHPSRQVTQTVPLTELLGQLYQHLGDFATECDAPIQAEEFYRRALAICPQTVELYCCLGDCLMAQGRKDAATVIYQAGITQADPLDAIPLQDCLDQVQAARLSLLAASSPPLSGIYLQTPDQFIVPNKSSTPLQEQPSKATAKVSVEHYLTAQAALQSCGGITCQRCMGDLVQQFKPNRVNKKGFRCGMNPNYPGPSLSRYTAVLPGGRAWIAPQKTPWAACNEIAIFTADNALLGELSRCYPWYLPGCATTATALRPIIEKAGCLPPVQRLPGRVAILSGLSAHIYYHWMFDLLPRIDILTQSLTAAAVDLSDIDYFVVNSIDKPFQKETLTQLNIPLEKVISSDRVSHLQADQLIVPSFPGYLDWVPPPTLDFLRRQFLTNDGKLSQPAPRQLPKRFYISRAQARYRQVLNEPAVIDLLSRYGFETVVLETLTVAEQAQLFAGAEAIVSPHGSGLTNLAFCAPNTIVIECFSPHYLRTDYWMISQYLGLSHYYLMGETCRFPPLQQLMYPSALVEDFLIDIDSLRSLIKTAGLASQDIGLSREIDSS